MCSSDLLLSSLLLLLLLLLLLFVLLLLLLLSYEWVRGRYDVICCIEGDAETAVGMKVAFLNSGLMDALMIHEVFDYNKAFSKAADATKSVTKPAE